MARPPTPAGATAALIAEKRFDGPTRSIERDVTVGTTAIQLLDNNPRRVYWLAQNRGANDITVSDTRDVTTSAGFLLAATGGANSMQVDEDGEAVTYDRYAISGVAGNTVRVLEILRV